MGYATAQFNIQLLLYQLDGHYADQVIQEFLSAQVRFVGKIIPFYAEFSAGTIKEMERDSLE